MYPKFLFNLRSGCEVLKHKKNFEPMSEQSEEERRAEESILRLRKKKQEKEALEAITNPEELISSFEFTKEALDGVIGAKVKHVAQTGGKFAIIYSFIFSICVYRMKNPPLFKIDIVFLLIFVLEKNVLFIL